MDALSKIRTLMDQYGYSEYQLAKISGVPQSTINSLFRNGNQPTLYTLERLCKAFDITLSEFFDDGSRVEGLTAEQRQMLEKWSSLTPQQKDFLTKLIQQL